MIYSKSISYISLIWDCLLRPGNLEYFRDSLIECPLQGWFKINFTTMKQLYIDQPDQLEALCQSLKDSPWLVVDTEFLRETTYYPKLCLLQIANLEVAACIDVLALPELTPLQELLYQPDTTKVFHAAHQDLEIFLHLWGRLPENLFDTQIAAALLGHGDQTGYAPLVKRLLGVALNKDQTRTNWCQRPLQAEQLDYAFDDVIYLGQVYQQLMAALDKAGRGSWLEEDFKALEKPAAYVTQPEDAWKKVKGQQLLHGVQYAVLQALAAWREHQAITNNRPRRQILADDPLLDMAKRMPATGSQLGKIRGLSERQLDRWQSQWLELIANAKSLPQESWPAPKIPPRLSLEDEARLDLLSAALRLLAAEQNMSITAIASRKDLESLLGNSQPGLLLQGWRRLLFGEPLLALLKGKARIEVNEQGIYFRP